MYALSETAPESSASRSACSLRAGWAGKAWAPKGQSASGLAQWRGGRGRGEKNVPFHSSAQAQPLALSRLPLAAGLPRLPRAPHSSECGLTGKPGCTRASLIGHLPCLVQRLLQLGILLLVLFF